jgi:hypothetical protein
VLGGLGLELACGLQKWNQRHMHKHSVVFWELVAHLSDCLEVQHVLHISDCATYLHGHHVRP